MCFASTTFFTDFANAMINPDKTQKNGVTKSLWEVIDTFLIVGAVTVTLILGVAYYYVGSNNVEISDIKVEPPVAGDLNVPNLSPRTVDAATKTEATQEANRQKIIKELLLTVIGGSIPVFLLFFLSAILFRRLNKIRKQDDQYSLANDVAHIVVASLAKPSADQLFNHKTDETRLLDSAQIEALLIQETGSLVAETGRSEIIGLLERGASVSIVVTSPIESVARFMAFRNATLTLSTALVARANRFQDHLRDFQKVIAIGSGKLTVRYIPYPIGTTLTLVDASSDDPRKRQGVMRISGFKVPFEKKLDIEFTSETSPETFERVHQEAMQLYSHASKCILIQGRPRIGKTAFLRSLCENNQSPYIYSILSEAIWDPNNPNQRLGFQVRTSVNGSNPTQFASRRNDGSYKCEAAIWDALADELLQHVSHGCVVVLDEIGPLQFESKKFLTTINAVFDNPTAHLFASLANPDVLGDSTHQKFWNHTRTTRLTLQSDTDTVKLRRLVEAELVASIQTCSAGLTGAI